ncbi:hypothetical protein [Terrarubrum flagellatum]|uniref:hypothetical protein n=1 Tax=Terrirubrum flagellatum TaxID=2895980 RepID=UPI0031454D56
MMASSAATIGQSYARLVERLRAEPGVAIGLQGKKGFGADALTTGDKIFAMLSKQGFTLKLPRDRVDQLIASKDGVRFDPGHGRAMKEWVVITPGREKLWLPLAKEALAFVGRKG